MQRTPHDNEDGIALNAYKNYNQDKAEKVRDETGKSAMQLADEMDEENVLESDKPEGPVQHSKKEPVSKFE